MERMEHLAEAQRQAIAERFPSGMAALMQACARGDGSARLEALRVEKALLQEPEPTTYMHRQVKAGRRHCGLVACVDAAAFASGTIKAHRETRPGQAEQWRSITRGCGAQLDSVILAFETNERIADLFEREVNDRPLFHVVAGDGATHTLWSGRRAQDLREAFAAVPRAYVLEGHHRIADAGPVLGMLLPTSEVSAHWSARLVHQPAGEVWHAWLRRHGTPILDGGVPPAGFADACVLQQGEVRWLRFRLPAPAPGASCVQVTEWGRLDALLRGMLSRDSDEATSWQPGEDRAAHLQGLVANASVASAILLAPPAVRELTQLADAGERLPAGSTWFEPRVRSGLWIHRPG